MAQGTVCLVDADEEFGEPGLRGYLEKNRIAYVMAVPKSTAATTATAQSGQLDELVTVTREGVAAPRLRYRIERAPSRRLGAHRPRWTPTTSR